MNGAVAPCKYKQVSCKSNTVRVKEVLHLFRCYTHKTYSHTQLTHTQLAHIQLAHTRLAHTHTTYSHTTYSHTTCSHTTCSHTTCTHTTYSHTTYSRTTDMDRRFAWQAWHLWNWAGSGDVLGKRRVAGDAAAVGVAGVALCDIDRHFAW